MCCGLRLAGLEGTPLSAVQFVPTVVLIVAVALLLDIALAASGGGENDNASGVALALRLAERFSSERLEHFDLHIVFTGAGKAMAAGMRSFVKRHRTALGRERTVFLNLDEVGAGALRYAVKEGPLVALKAHPQLVELCEAIAEDDRAGGVRSVINRSASDGYVARSRGLPAITITSRDERGYAGPRVEEGAIERAEAFCAELIARLDAEVGPELAGTLRSSG